MSRRLALMFLACSLSPACSVPKDTATDDKRPSVPPDINDGFLDPDLDPRVWLGRFEVDSREIYASREAVVKALALSPGTFIADVGSGTGLFLKLFSQAVSAEGKVYAVDISPGLVEYLKKRVDEEQLNNVEIVLSRADSTELPEASVDTIFLCDTYHHFEKHEAMLASMRDSLREGGQLIVIDFERVPGTSRDWILEHVRAGKAVFRGEIEAAGFVLREEVKIAGFQENYFLRFEKP